MAAITVEDFYKANIDKEKEYVPIYAAYAVSAGENIVIDGITTTAEEDGYEFDMGAGFLSNDEFAAQTAPADELELAVPKEELSERDLQNMTPVRRGDPIVITVSDGLMAQGRAGSDGFLLAAGKDAKVFASNFAITSKFNYAGQKYETRKESIVTFNDEVPTKGIILDKETTFALKTGDYTAPAGSFIYPDPESEDGYSVEDLKEIPNMKLRISAAWSNREFLAQHKNVLERQAKLKSRAPKIKLV